MAPSKKLKANELVMLVAGLLRLDVEFMARVGNLPVRNLRSWLAGKKENLRLQSVVGLLSLLGLSAGSNGIHLDGKRVHFWYINDGMFTKTKAAYQTLTALSRLLANCMITKVVPHKQSLADKLFRAYYLVSDGSNVRVVICVNKGMFKRARISPDVIKGASWLEDNEHHTITTSNVFWNHVREHDLTTHEFDRMFYRTEENVSWGDVALMAREFGVTPADVAKFVMESKVETQTETVDVGDSGGIDIDGGGPMLLMIANGARRAA